MGKKSNKGSNRVVFICLECSYLAGKIDSQFHKGGRVYNSSCDICHRKKPVTEAKDWGFFTPDVIAGAKTKLRELGLDKRTFADPRDVKTLVNVVQDLLKDKMSDLTKETLQQTTDKLAKGEPIEVYLTKQLTYCFTQDAAKLPKKPRKKPSDLVVIEGGKEREVDNGDENV